MPKTAKRWDADNPLAPEDAIRLLTRVRVQCDLPDGPQGCWVWQGCVAKGRAHMHFMGRAIGVRRAVYEAHHGFEPPPGMYVVACDDPDCVAPHCLKALPRALAQKRAVKRGAYVGVAVVQKRTLTRRRNSRFTNEMIERARTMPGTHAAVARELGMDKSYVRLLRLGKARMPMQGLWAGLAAGRGAGA